MNDKLRLEWFESTFPGAEYSAKVKRVLGVQVITSFADRENKGKQPVPDDFPVIVEWSDGLNEKSLGKFITWNGVNCRSEIESWKPDCEALLKMQAEHDKHNESIIKACDEANKKEGEMIYTQEMKDNGELPSVGMKFSTEFYGNHIAEAVSKTQVCFIGNNGNFDALDIKACLPYKTPEEIELEEAKKKQIDDISKLLSRNGMSHDPIWIKCLQSHGHLAEIILPFKK